MKKIICVIYAAIICMQLQAQPSRWLQQKDFGGEGRSGAVGFSIGNKGYIGTGNDRFRLYQDFWEYNSVTGAWTQKADFPGEARTAAVGFSIGSKGYLGTGSAKYFQDKKDFWEYNPATNKWAVKADFGGGMRWSATGFSIGNRGYIATGLSFGGFKKDCWEYNPITDNWQQKADFGGEERYSAVGFGIDGKGYLGTGYVQYDKLENGFKDFWEYDPAADEWTRKADFAGGSRWNAIGFSMGGRGYAGTGTNGQRTQNDFWEYNPAADVWIQRTYFEGSARELAVGFSIGSYGYIGMGNMSSEIFNDWWKYTPPSVPVLSIDDNQKSEGSTGTGSISKMRFELRLNAPSVYTINALYETFDISAFTSSDYISKSGAVVFNPGDTVKLVTIKIINDSIAEPDETFGVRLLGADNALLIDSVAIGTIINDDVSLVAPAAAGSLALRSHTLKLYPNPVTDKLNITINALQNAPVFIRITDIYGRQVYAEKIIAAAGISTHSINAVHFAKGMYTLEIITDKTVTKEKFLKE